MGNPQCVILTKRAWSNYSMRRYRQATKIYQHGFFHSLAVFSVRPLFFGVLGFYLRRRSALTKKKLTSLTTEQHRTEAAPHMAANDR